ncbi:DUF3891 family protein [Virgibacillus sp. DJP39]|uniref:DUF3891 family protein n=1 Tax=Virgibacillus sp. DJP39 TaxID=3409790 RepID=UPI003BB56C47
MIIRERENEVVMISQDDHARISGMFAADWTKYLLKQDDKRNSVELAINEHDRGWIPLDRNPFLNDQTKIPFSFIDYPNEIKLVFYKRGIDEVEEMDSYAGLLCSCHYARFAANDGSADAQRFVKQEHNRQNRLKNQVEGFDEALFQFHYDLLQFSDNLSLYVCLNEPGVSQNDVHYFFRQGLPVPSTLSFLGTNPIQIDWKDMKTILLSEFPFNNPFDITITQKLVSKQSINDAGIFHAYENAIIERVSVSIDAD